MRIFRIAAAAMLALLPMGAWAVSAAPIEIQLKQVDNGATVWAIARGNEYGDWMETLEGYSIVESAGVWYYAEQRADGTLSASAQRAELGLPPTRAPWPKHLHPPLREVEENQLLPLSARTTQERSLVFTQPVLTILVDFNNIAFTYSDASFQTLIYSASNSVKDYYLENTYNNFTLTPAAESYATANDGIVHVSAGTNHPNLGNGAWYPVVGAYIAAADPYVNFASFDTNADAAISSSELSIVLILAGYENSFGGSSSLTPRVWGHKSSASPPLTLDGKTVSPYTAFGERHGTSMPGTHQATIGIMCHELGHLMLGFPDLYDTDDTSEGVGEWCVMGTGSWNGLSASGDSPAHISAPLKAYVDITTPNEVTAPTDGVALLEAYNNSSIEKIWIDPYRSPFGEYFLIENRQKSGYDADLPGHGLLIWHVDGALRSNSNETHKLVDLEEADGLAQLDANTSRGDAGDAFPGSTVNTTFDGATNPNSDDYSNADTGIVVDGISLSGPSMTADVAPKSGLGQTLNHNEYNYPGSTSLGGTTAWTAIVYTNDSAMDRLEGFQVYVNDTAATVDFQLYASLVGTTPTTLLYGQAGFAGVSGWNRFLLATPQSFPQGSTRIVVLKIVNAAGNFPVQIDPLGPNSGLAYIDANGIGAYSALIYDPAQTILLGAGQKDPVYANFSFNGPESGTSANPYNTFAETLACVLSGGTINLSGTAADTISSWTGTLDSPLTITASPAGSVRIGATGGQS